MSEEMEKFQRFQQLLYVKKVKENLKTGKMEEVTEPGQMLIAYDEKKNLYLDAYSKYLDAEEAFKKGESKEAIDTWRYMEDELRQSVRSTYDDWVTSGYKNEVEAMCNYIEQFKENREKSKNKAL
ncbi:hypothetical protein ACFTQL_23805 [Peribacillus butanolivorans]|uniref:hypothetical protein n=1 Tax=Peribacillus butanolivorans TaxID=421767 RepID=UPI003634A621